MFHMYSPKIKYFLEKGKKTALLNSAAVKQILTETIVSVFTNLTYIHAFILHTKQPTKACFSLKPGLSLDVESCYDKYFVLTISSYMTERIRSALLSQTLLRVVVSRQLRCVHSNSVCYITDLSGLQTIHHVATTDGIEAPSSRCLESRSRRRLLRSAFSFLFSFLDELTESA